MSAGGDGGGERKLPENYPLCKLCIYPRLVEQKISHYIARSYAERANQISLDYYFSTNWLRVIEGNVPV